MDRKIILAALLVTGMALSGIALADDGTQEEADAQAFGMHKFGGPMIDGEGRGMPLLDEEARAEMEAQREERTAEMEAKMEEMRAAIEAGDYETWAGLAKECSCPRGNELLENVNGDNFHLLLELQELRDRQDEIMEELGLPENGPRGTGFGRMPRGRGMDFADSEE